MAPDRDRLVRAVTAMSSVGLDLAALREAVLEAVARAVAFDVHVWVATDPLTAVGVAPHADLPRLGHLPATIRAKYLEPLNRWTSLAPGRAVGLHAATGGVLTRSSWWRDALAAQEVVDVASLVVGDGYGTWSFVDLWRTGGHRPFGDDELGLLGLLGPALAVGVRAAVASTFDGGDARGSGSARTGPVVLVVDDDLHVVARTPQTEDHLRALLPPGPGAAAVPAAALNVAAQLLAREAGVDDHPATGRVHVQGTGWMTLRADRLGAGSIGVTLEPSTPDERADLVARAHGLTPRETELALLLLTGQDTRHLVRSMGLSEHTVQDHLKAVFAKSRTSSRTAFVARVLGTA